MRCGIKFKMQALLADKGQPGSVVKSIVPAQNHFVFFEVSAASFHQVRTELFGDVCCVSVAHSHRALKVIFWSSEALFC